MTYRIAFESGEAFAFPPSEDTLLRGALRAGLGFPNECGVGGCGNCRFELVSGEMETLWAEAPGLSERERKRGTAARLPVAAAERLRDQGAARRRISPGRSRRRGSTATLSADARDRAGHGRVRVPGTEAPARFLARTVRDPSSPGRRRARAPIRCRTCRTARASGASSSAGRPAARAATPCSTRFVSARR